MNNHLRHVALLLVAAGSFAAMMIFPPLLQDQAYHHFADQRVIFGIRRFLDMATNLPFLVIGISGFLHCVRSLTPDEGLSWALFFAGITMVGIGSGYYHADPTDRSLVWDRLPMTMSFMAVLVAVLGERIDGRLQAYALAPAALAGVLSVLWWAWTGDLRLYCWIQLLPMIVIPLTVALFPGRKSENRLFGLALLSYALAKVAELNDHAIYGFTDRVISGHSLKHLLAAAGCAAILVMVKSRRAFVSYAASSMIMAREEVTEGASQNPPAPAIRGPRNRHLRW